MDKIFLIFFIILISFYLRFIYLNSEIYYKIKKKFKNISYVMFIFLLYMIKFLKKKPDKFFIYKIILFILFRFIYRSLIPSNYLENNLYNCNDIMFIIGIFLFCYINI